MAQQVLSVFEAYACRTKFFPVFDKRARNDEHRACKLGDLKLPVPSKIARRSPLSSNVCQKPASPLSALPNNGRRDEDVREEYSSQRALGSRTSAVVRGIWLRSFSAERSASNFTICMAMRATQHSSSDIARGRV